MGKSKNRGIRKPWPTRSDQELRQVALDILNNVLFSSLQVRDERELQHIFLPLMFVDEELREKFVRYDVSMFTGEIAKASPVGWNGYPIFFTMAVYTRGEMKKVVAYIREVRSMIGDYIEGKKESENAGSGPEPDTVTGTA